MTSEKIAKVILSHLGGKKFIVMTGSKNFKYSTDEEGNTHLSMHLVRNISGAKYLTITYNLGEDWYYMKFERTDKNDNLITVAERCQVEANCLCLFFTEITGLRTTL